jgi:P27 family predicted phage terminase small subunit
MGRRGPAPEPTALKRLRGNPGKRALNKEEPRPATTMPRCPAHLGKEARAEWRRVARGLHEAGLLTQIDRAALAVYCQAWERWVRAEAQVARHGEVVKTIAGNVMQNPYLSIANRSMKQMRDMARELGMTPSARSQIRVQPPEGPSLADLLFEAVGEA